MADITAAQIARVRQLSAEPTTTEFSDADLITMANTMAKVVDSAGLAPSAAAYVDTYDLYLLTAEVWRIKAGLVVDEFDFRAEGSQFVRSQKYEMRLAQAKRYSDMSAQRSASTAT